MDDTTTLDDASIPEGTAFLDLLWDRVERCTEQTDKRLPQMGVKAPLCLSNVGTALSLLDRVSSCWWGCSDDDHTLQYLAGRAESSAMASLSLLRGGYYEEALNVVRRAGEIANLLFLFVSDPSLLDKWRSLNHSEQKEMFSPVKVRIMLDEKDCMIPIEKDRYRELSSLGTHASPNARPQAFNPENQAIIGGRFQEAGALLVLNEVAVAVAWVTAACARLSHLAEKERRRLLTSAVALFRSIGGVTITEMPSLFGEDSLAGKANGAET